MTLDPLSRGDNKCVTIFSGVLRVIYWLKIVLIAYIMYDGNYHAGSAFFGRSYCEVRVQGRGLQWDKIFRVHFFASRK